MEESTIHVVVSFRAGEEKPVCDIHRGLFMDRVPGPWDNFTTPSDPVSLVQQKIEPNSVHIDRVPSRAVKKNRKIEKPRNRSDPNRKTRVTESVTDIGIGSGTDSVRESARLGISLHL